MDEDGQPGYVVERRDDYILFQLNHVLPFEHMDQAISGLLELINRYHLTKLLLVTHVRYVDVEAVHRMEGARVADNFRFFDRVAVCATDPAELEYLKSSTELLKLAGVIRDPDNFRHFSDPHKATEWLVR